MPSWTPILVLPGADIRGSVESKKAALVGRGEQRIVDLIEKHPAFGDFLSRFQDQFGNDVHPSILLIKTRAGKSYFTAEAITAFRDVVAMCVVPFARARRLVQGRPQPLAFSNVFTFYPWMIDRDYDGLVCSTPAILGTHLLSRFRGQSSAEQVQTTIMEYDIDVPLAKTLLSRWDERFSKKDSDWKNRALFRSLNMANEASRMPTVTAATFYEFGRSLAIWVSAFEILTHPGKGEANTHTVFAALNKVTWANESLKSVKYQIAKNKPPRNLACHVYEKIYSLRNDFLHGNEVSIEKLVVGKAKRQFIDYAACLYRIALTGELPVLFPGTMPSLEEPRKFGRYIADHMTFEGPQSEYKKALQTFSD